MREWRQGSEHVERAGEAGRMKRMQVTRGI